MDRSAGLPDTRNVDARRLGRRGGDEPAKADHHEEEAGDHHERGAYPEEPGEGEEVPDTGGPNPSVVLGAGAAVFVASLMLLYGTTRARR